MFRRNVIIPCPTSISLSDVTFCLALSSCNVTVVVKSSPCMIAWSSTILSPSQTCFWMPPDWSFPNITIHVSLISRPSSLMNFVPMTRLLIPIYTASSCSIKYWQIPSLKSDRCEDSSLRCGLCSSHNRWGAARTVNISPMFYVRVETVQVNFVKFVVPLKCWWHAWMA